MSTSTKILHVSLDSDNYFPGHYSVKHHPSPNQLACYKYKLNHQHPAEDDVEEEEDVDQTIEDRPETFRELYPWDQLEEIEIENITILDFQGNVDTSLCKKLLSDINQGENLEQNITAILKPNCTLNEVEFTPCISLRATFKPRRLRLYVSFPYFTIGASPDGKSLHEYRNSVNIPSPAADIKIHEAGLFAFNADLLAILRSETNQPAVPFFPNQNRSSNLHMMVHVLCLLLQHSNRKITQHYRNTLLDCDRKVLNFVSTPLEDSRETKARLKENENLGLELNGTLRDMTIMMHVVGLQLQTLEDLRRIFRNSWKTYDADKGYDGNVVRIPFRFEKKECVTLILRALDEAIEERRSFKMVFEEWTRWGQSLTDYLAKRLGEATAAMEAQEQQAKIQEQRIVAVEAQEQQAKTQEQMIAAMEAQEHQAEVQEEILADIKQQAETMSWFTAVTALFLPLTFFTSYFAVDWEKGGFPHNDGDFWKVSAPLTFAFMCITLSVIFRRKVKAREIEMVNPFEKARKAIFRKRARENTMDPGGRAADAGVMRTVWNKVAGGGEPAGRSISCSTAEKGESSQGVAG